MSAFPIPIEVFEHPVPTTRTGLRVINVVIPIKGKVTETKQHMWRDFIRGHMSGVMSVPPTHVLPDDVPRRPHWYSIRHDYVSRWTYQESDVEDASGTAAILGALYKYLPPAASVVIIR